MGEDNPKNTNEKKETGKSNKIELLKEELELTPEEAKELYREVQLSEFFSGPLPPPRLMKGYDDLIENGAERLLSLFEKQARHRMDMEKSQIVSDIERAGSGLKMGYSLALLIVIGGLALIFLGFPVEGFVALLGIMTALIGIFVYSFRERKQNLQRRNGNRKNIPLELIRQMQEEQTREQDNE